MKITSWDKIKTGTLLIVTWNDVTVTSSWLSDADAQSSEPSTCKSVGWFVNDDKLNIRITFDVAEDGEKSVIVIPKGIIRDIKKVDYKR